MGLRLSLEEETQKFFPSSNNSREVSVSPAVYLHSCCYPDSQVTKLTCMQVRDRLVAACERRGVRFHYNSSVEQLATSAPCSSSEERACSATAIRPSSEASTSTAAAPPAAASASGGRWACTLQDGRQMQADRVVLCSGGLSFPAVGTDGTGYRILQGLGHRLHATYPALTPLTGPHPGGQQLAGLSLRGVQLEAVRYGARPGKKGGAALARRGGFLFTHRGWSGPSVLDVSHHAVLALERGGGQQRPGGWARGLCPGTPLAVACGQASSPIRHTLPLQVLIVTVCDHATADVRINWMGEDAAAWDARLRAGGSAHVGTLLQRAGLPQRLSDALCVQLGLQARPACQLRREERDALVAALTQHPLPVVGHEGYKKAEVTGGGVPLSEVDCATMESRLLPGLHLAGEVLDVFGRIGGYNFWWAWLTGRMAGRACGGMVGTANVRNKGPARRKHMTAVS